MGRAPEAGRPALRAGLRAAALACLVLLATPATRGAQPAGPTLLADGGVLDGLRRAKLRLALASAVARHGKESLPAAKAEMELAEDYYFQSEFNDALPLMQHAIAAGERLLAPDDLNLAIALYYLAATYYQFEDVQRALPPLERAMQIGRRRLPPDDERFARARLLLASIYRDAGDYERALALDQENVDFVARTQGTNTLAYALALNEIAVDRLQTGQYALARTAMQSAMAIGAAHLPADDLALALGRNNLAAVYANLGQFDLALPLIEQALKVYEAKGPERNEVNVLMHLVYARTLCGLRRCQEALLQAQRAVDIYEKLDNQAGRAYRSLLVLAFIDEQLGRTADARPVLERALRVRQSIRRSNNPDLAFVLELLARTRLKLGDRTAALDLLQQALPVAVRGGNPEFLWRVQDGLRETLAADGQRDAAIYWGKAAINTIQSMRASLRGLEDQAQQAFVQDRRSPYKELAALLIDAGRLAEAEQVLALLKDQELSQLVRRGDAARPGADLLGAERTAGDDYEKLVAGELARARELDELERRSRYEKLSEADEAHRRDLQEQATGWRDGFKKWLAALPARLAARTAGGAAPGRQQLASQANALSTLVRAEPDTLGLYYVVADDEISIILSSARGSFGRRIAVGTQDLNRHIAALRLALVDPALDPRPASLALYRILIEPIADELEQVKPRTLVLSLTDNLRYVPFAALYDGRHYLVERYALAQVVSGAKGGADAGRNAWQVSAFGMTQAAPPLAPLKGVRDELASIVRVAGTSGGLLPGTIRLDRDFDRAQLEAALRGEHRVVHIGSHFVLSATGDEESSYLLLGDGNHLSLDQIATLDFSGVDQLTLSACDTASGGGRDENGIEVEGMAAIVAQQGAGSVLASLWPVSDRSTASLMRAFYEGRTSAPGLSRAQALRRAQLMLLQGSQGVEARTDAQPSASASAHAGAAATPAPGPYRADPAAPFAHPFFWAPFVILGNWR